MKMKTRSQQHVSAWCLSCFPLCTGEERRRRLRAKNEAMEDKIAVQDEKSIYSLRSIAVQ
jgi:hypothetical protein